MKDERSVLELLSYNNIHCEKSRVLGNKFGDSKISHLSYIVNQYTSLRRSDFLFIDDNIRHINEVKPLKIKSMLASWGYSSKSLIESARRKKINILDLDDCEKVVFDG